MAGLEAGADDYLSKPFDTAESFSSHPDVPSLHQAMQAVYRADREALARRARRFVVAHYDMDAIFERRWVPYLASLELRVRREDARAAREGTKGRRSRHRPASRRASRR